MSISVSSSAWPSSRDVLQQAKIRGLRGNPCPGQAAKGLAVPQHPPALSPCRGMGGLKPVGFNSQEQGKWEPRAGQPDRTGCLGEGSPGERGSPPEAVL